MSKQKKITLTPKKVEEMKHEIAAKCLILMCACLMDSLGMDREQITEFATDFERYSAAVDNHIITLNKVREIIKEETGLEVHSWG